MKPLIILALILAAVATLQANDVYTNPVLHPDNYPDVTSAADPFVFKDHDGVYYCYVTGQGFPVFTSRDLVNWTYQRRAFPKARAKWATANFWAPEVIKVGNYYYLHYTASETEDSPKRIGLARATTPAGPFDDLSDQPFYTLGAKGCIDSHIFIDDDQRTYLYYSLALKQNIVDGVNRSEIWAVELNPDLSGTKSAAKQLFYPTHSWESNVNEAPTLLKRNNRYYLMYSGNGYANANYAVGYATATSPLGPFTKYSSNPILIHTGLGKQVTGTGHNSVTTSPDGTELICVYHSHINLDELGGGPRKVNIDRIGFTPDHILYIDGPTITPQNYPSSTQLTIPPGANSKHAPALYPNPATSQVTITLPGNQSGAVTISDLNGRTLHTQEFHSHTDRLTLPLHTLHSGAYIVQLHTDCQIQTNILIKT